MFFSFSLFAASKKESLNQTEVLIDEETMFNAGSWKLYMEKCDGKMQKKLLKELPRLSWPDYRNYTKGAAKYASGWSSIPCDKAETKRGKEFYQWIIAELKILTRSESSNTSSDSWITQKETLEEVDEIDDIEEKLSKLKSLFDKKLITEEDYKEKKKEILDNM